MPPAQCPAIASCLQRFNCFSPERGHPLTTLPTARRSESRKLSVQPYCIPRITATVKITTNHMRPAILPQMHEKQKRERSLDDRHDQHAHEHL